MKKAGMKKYIHLYYEGTDSTLNICELASYMRGKTGMDVDMRGNVIPQDKDTQDFLAQEFAMARVINPQKEELNTAPLSAEIGYESRLLLHQKHSGLLYDGFCLQKIFRSILPGGEHNLAHAHIIITSRLFGTFEDNRYHARVAVFGAPSIISLTGLIEAPAKPREFYLRKQFGQDIPGLLKEFKDRLLDYNDSRIIEVLKGYLMQSFFYHVSGNPFCDDPHCRLYNAHWQEEVIFAQIGGEYEFCQRHEQGNLHHRDTEARRE